MSGMIGRLIAQAVMFGVSVGTKAFAQAYQRAQAGGGQAAAGATRALGRMELDQARQILNLEKTYTRDEVIAQFTKYYEGNDPDRGGSFYVQSKVFNAREALLDDFKRRSEAAKAAASKPKDSGSQEMR